MTVQTKHDLQLSVQNPNLLGSNQLLESVCYLLYIDIAFDKEMWNDLRMGWGLVRFWRGLWLFFSSVIEENMGLTISALF